MNDKELLEELKDQRTWWEQRLEEIDNKAADIKNQIVKLNRLINLLELKIQENGSN